MEQVMLLLLFYVMYAKKRRPPRDEVDPPTSPRQASIPKDVNSQQVLIFNLNAEKATIDRALHLTRSPWMEIETRICDLI
jgi:hypothetical protein